MLDAAVGCMNVAPHARPQGHGCWFGFTDVVMFRRESLSRVLSSKSDHRPEKASVRKKAQSVDHAGTHVPMHDGAAGAAVRPHKLLLQNYYAYHPRI